jgi:hypothetical protein
VAGFHCNSTKLIVAHLIKTFPVGFQVLTAASMKMALIWIVAPCSLVKFTDVSEVLTLMMEAEITSETSVNFYQITRRNDPKDSHLQNIPCPNILPSNAVSRFMIYIYLHL